MMYIDPQRLESSMSKARKWGLLASGGVILLVVVGWLNANLGHSLESRDQPVTEDDLRILVRADELLSDASVWNRTDDRECADDESAGKRSLFCALHRACIDILGEYDHRRVALQEVRFAVEDATRGRNFAHRLRDFNNLPSTELADLKAVLSTAKQRVSERLGKPR